jgi:hypothetical protein
MIDDLIHLAEHLATYDVGRPRQASLKRAISTAYYAVFHALAELCAHELVKWRAGWPGRAAISRSLEHSSASRLATMARNHELFAGSFLAIGAALLELQRERHVADYDPRPLPYGRDATIARVAQARDTVRLIRQLGPEARAKLAIFLIARHQR